MRKKKNNKNMKNMKKKLIKKMKMKKEEEKEGTKGTEEEKEKEKGIREEESRDDSEEVLLRFLPIQRSMFLFYLAARHHFASDVAPVEQPFDSGLIAAVGALSLQTASAPLRYPAMQQERQQAGRTLTGDVRERERERDVEKS